MRGPPPPFIDTRRGGVHLRRGLEVVVFSPKRGRAVDVCCRKYTVWHRRVRRRAWQLSYALSSVLWRSRRRPCDSCGCRGVFCRGYRPPYLTCWHLEGPAGGGLALVKARAAFEGRAHTCRGFCSREKYAGLVAQWREQCRARPHC